MSYNKYINIRGKSLVAITFYFFKKIKSYLLITCQLNKKGVVFVEKITISIRMRLKTFKKFKHMCLIKGCTMSEHMEKIVKENTEEYEEEHHIKL